MKVSLGTIEVDDATRKAIRRDMGRGGVATRDDVKTYLLEKVDGALVGAGSARQMTGTPPDAGGLPEPTAGGSSAVSTPTVSTPEGSIY